MDSNRETFCSGLFLSARWFVLSQIAEKGTHLVVLPNREAAEYCSADLYNLVEGDCVFFLPDSGGAVERSNYKSSLGVQRTAAIGKMMDPGKGPLFVVTYPTALDEPVPEQKKITGALLTVQVGQEISYDTLRDKLVQLGFERVDFVSAPGQYAIRGAVIDIFSYSLDHPYRLTFFGNEIEKIHTFDCNTQLSIDKVDKADIYPDIVAGGQGEGGVSLLTLLKEDAVVWLDSSDMYKDRPFFPELTAFRHVYLDIPLQRQGVDNVAFSIAPQPVFNKNFELLLSDIRTRLENNYKVYIYGEKESQLERLRSIMLQDEHALLPEFVKGKNIHAGFIDNEDHICCYSDHEIFDRFHRVRLRRTVEKSEQLTLNDLSSFNLGDYIVHIDHAADQQAGLEDLGHDEDIGQVPREGHRQGTHPALREAPGLEGLRLLGRHLPPGRARILLHVRGYARPGAGDEGGQGGYGGQLPDGPPRLRRRGLRQDGSGHPARRKWPSGLLSRPSAIPSRWPCWCRRPSSPSSTSKPSSPASRDSPARSIT